MIRHPYRMRPLRSPRSPTGAPTGALRGALWAPGARVLPCHWVDVVGGGRFERGFVGDGGRGFASRPPRPGRRGATYRARIAPTGPSLTGAHGLTGPKAFTGPKGLQGARRGPSTTRPRGPTAASPAQRTRGGEGGSCGVWSVKVSLQEAPRAVRRGPRAPSGAPTRRSKGPQGSPYAGPRGPYAGPRGPYAGPRGPYGGSEGGPERGVLRPLGAREAWRGRVRRVGRRLAQVGRILRSVPRGFNPFGAGAQAVPRARASDPRFWEGPRGVDRPGPQGGRPGGGGWGEGVRPGPLAVDRGRGRGHGLAPGSVFRQGRSRCRGRGLRGPQPRREARCRARGVRPFKGVGVLRGRPRRDALGVASPAAYGRGFARRYGYARFPRIPRAPRHGRRVWPPRIPPRWVRPAPLRGPQGAWDPGARGAWVPIVRDPARPEGPAPLTRAQGSLLAVLTRRAHAGEAGPVGMPDDATGAALDQVRRLPRALARWAWVRAWVRGTVDGLAWRRYGAWASRRGPWDRPWWARWLGLWLPMRAIPRTAWTRGPRPTPMEEAMGAIRSRAPRAAALRAAARATAQGHARRRLAAHRGFQARRGLGRFGALTRGRGTLGGGVSGPTASRSLRTAPLGGCRGRGRGQGRLPDDGAQDVPRLRGLQGSLRIWAGPRPSPRLPSGPKGTEGPERHPGPGRKGPKAPQAGGTPWDRHRARWERAEARAVAVRARRSRTGGVLPWPGGTRVARAPGGPRGRVVGVPVAWGAKPQRPTRATAPWKVIQQGGTLMAVRVRGSPRVPLTPKAKARPRAPKALPKAPPGVPHRNTPWVPRRPRGRPRCDTAWWGGVRRRYQRACRALGSLKTRRSARKASRGASHGASRGSLRTRGGSSKGPGPGGARKG